MYLPRRRTIIETKRVGLADRPEEPQPREKNPESPKQQLERYLRSEIAYESQSLGLEGESEREWIGIVTDGRVWHVWRYPHGDLFKSTVVVVHHRPGSAEELVTGINGFVEGALVGREWIPADLSKLFAPLLEELRELYSGLGGVRRTRTKTKFSLWVDMLTTSSMVPEEGTARDRLFVSHSFLVALARGVIRVLRDPTLQPDVEHTLGDGFVAWIIDSQTGKQWAKRLLKEIYTYEWRRRPGDVLRPLYESIVGKEDRTVFGEFYTPDWLAELLVREVCDDDWCRESIEKAAVANRNNRDLGGVGVLDPTCGSGTFLYHAARRLVAHPTMETRSDADKAMIVCALVHGIDVHPVAAEIARATLLRALPAVPRHEKASLRVYEGDALLTSDVDDTHSLFQTEEGEIRIRTPGGNEVHLPIAFVERAEFADDLRRIVLYAIEGAGLPGEFMEGLEASGRDAITACYQELVAIIKEEGNSVWTWYIWNVTGPYLLSQKKVNRIVANPPWVKMANIQAKGRKRTLEAFATRTDIDLWTGGKQAPHFDIAQLFVKRCRALYLADQKENPAAWLVKKAALKSGNWERFRKWHGSVLEQTLDLEKVQPFGGGDARRSCVLFDRTSIDGHEGRHLVVECGEGGRPGAAERLERVWPTVTVSSAPIAIEQATSGYVDDKGMLLFRTGATIVPKVLSVVETLGAGTRIGHTRVRTMRSQHSPWSEVEEQSGEVPDTWLRGLITSNDVLAFSLSTGRHADVLVPVDCAGQLSPVEAGKSGFWNGLDGIYQEYCGTGRHTPKRLIANLDFSSKLSKQLSDGDGALSLVLYPNSGDVMRGCRVRSGCRVIGHTLSWFIAANSKEAAYLVALLNAPSLKEAFAQSRESGRHFVLLPWRKIPIRRYDGGNRHHVALARLTGRAEGLVEAWFASPQNAAPTLGQVGLSSRIRKLLVDEGVFPEIDRIVRKLLPNQCR